MAVAYLKAFGPVQRAFWHLAWDRIKIRYGNSAFQAVLLRCNSLMK
jgi:hypothetical protein